MYEDNEQLIAIEEIMPGMELRVAMGHAEIKGQVEDCGGGILSFKEGLTVSLDDVHYFYKIAGPEHQCDWTIGHYEGKTYTTTFVTAVTGKEIWDQMGLDGSSRRNEHSDDNKPVKDLPGYRECVLIDMQVWKAFMNAPQGVANYAWADSQTIVPTRYIDNLVDSVDTLNQHNEEGA